MTTDSHLALVRCAGRVTVREVPTAVPSRGEVLLAPDHVGVCGTDLQILRGLRGDRAAVLGHEGSATIVATGGPITGLEVGGRVIVNPTHPSDDTFLLGHNVDGMWSERVVIPAGAVASGLVLATEHIPRDAMSALIEPLAAVMYGRLVSLASSRTPPTTLVVWGDGVIGHLARRWWAAQSPQLNIVHVHHSDAGLSFTAGSTSDVDGPVADLRYDDPAVELTLRASIGSTTAILATPRTATAEALRRVERSVRSDLTVHVHGGLQAGPVELSCGAVDVGAIRARNCGGEPVIPVSETFDRVAAGAMTICGHRGVSNALLVAAANELTTNGSAYRDLITHQVDMTTAADLLTEIASGKRIFDGRRVLKATIRVAT